MIPPNASLCSKLKKSTNYCIDVPDGTPCVGYYVNMPGDEDYQKICRESTTPGGFKTGCEPGDIKCKQIMCVNDPTNLGYTKWVDKEDTCECPPESPKKEIDKSNPDKQRCAPIESNCTYIKGLEFKIAESDKETFDKVHFINPSSIGSQENIFNLFLEKNTI